MHKEKLRTHDIFFVQFTNLSVEQLLVSFIMGCTWLTPKLVVPSSTTSPCMFTLTRLEAVILLYIIPGKKVKMSILQR